MLRIPHHLRLFFVSLLLALVGACSKEEPVPEMLDVAPVPANPGLSPAGRELLMRLSRNYGKSTVAGQAEYREQGDYVALNYINSVAGRRPVIAGFDLIDYSPSRREFGADPGNLIEHALDLAQNGKMVLTFNWHWNAPMHLLNDEREPWWRAYYANGSEFNLRYAMRNPSSPEHQALLRDIDVIAEQLKRLAERDIPVLWRPLHMAEGGWFWWGAKGPEPFKELWRLMFARMTDQHGLNNLIWVLTSEDPEWYPGDDVVDIVGVDAYPSDGKAVLLENWNDLLRRHNGRKMIALTEFGGVPDVEEMHRSGVWFSYFVSWTDENRGKLGPKNVPSEYLLKVYQSPAVTTLDEWHDSSTGAGSPATGGAPPPAASTEPKETSPKP